MARVLVIVIVAKTAVDVPESPAVGTAVAVRMTETKTVAQQISKNELTKSIPF